MDKNGKNIIDKVFETVLSKNAIVFFLALYFLSMLIIPFYEVYDSSMSLSKHWEEVQSVWRDWQGYNAAIMAFFTAIASLWFYKKEEIRKQKLKFRAYAALLPDELSKINDYCIHSIQWSFLAWCFCDQKESNGERSHGILSGRQFPIEPPNFPDLDRDLILSALSVSADKEVMTLSELMQSLQIVRSRLKNDFRDLTSENGHFTLSLNMIDRLYNLAKIYTLTMRLFSFVREQKTIWPDFITMDEVVTAFANSEVDEFLSIRIMDIPNLRDRVMQRIQANKRLI